jgi:hypothetical protein
MARRKQGRMDEGRNIGRSRQERVLPTMIRLT